MICIIWMYMSSTKKYFPCMLCYYTMQPFAATVEQNGLVLLFWLMRSITANAARHRFATLHAVLSFYPALLYCAKKHIKFHYCWPTDNILIFAAESVW